MVSAPRCRPGARGLLALLLLLPLPGARGLCGTLPRLSHAIPHDTSRTEGFPIGTEVTYRCRDGFVKIPGQSDTLVCLSNSEWSAIGEFCGASCGAPPRISSAVLSKEDEKKNYHPSGTTVSYVCRPGYESTELKPVITCLENLTWSEAPEFCRGKSCGVPKGPEHGRAVALTNDLYGARANIICDDGFRLHGRTFIQCMLKGDRVEWSQLPTCQVTITQDKPTTVPPEGTEVAGTSSGTCDSPPRLSFAELPGAVNNSYPVGTELKYSCRPGYILGSGKSPLVTCLDNSTWSVDPEFCVVIITQDKPTTILPEGAEIAGTSSDSALNTAGNSAEPESGGLGIDRRIGITGIGPGIDTCIIGIIIAVVIVILIVILIVLLIRIGNIGPGIDTCIICIIIAVVIVILIVLLIRIIYVGPGIDTYIICIIIAFVIVILFVLLIHIIYVALNKKRKKKKGSYGVNLDSPKYHIAPEDDLQMSETKSNLIIEV